MEFINEEKIRDRNRKFKSTGITLDNFVNQRKTCSSLNILIDFLSRIPPDFPWPKLEKSRTPLNPITNTDKQPQPTVNNNPEPPSSSQDLERLFYCTPPSPAKPLPLLSSCADYTTSSQTSQHLSQIYPSSLEFFTSSSSQLSNRTQLFTTEETFSLNFSQSQHEIKQETEQFIEQTVSSPKTHSNHSSPSKYCVLNTPERPDRIHRHHLSDHDWLNDLLSSSDPPIVNQTQSVKRCLLNSSKPLKDQLGVGEREPNNSKMNRLTCLVSFFV